MPFKVSAQILTTDWSIDFSWPTLAELNEDLFPYPWSYGKEFDGTLIGDTDIVPQGFFIGPPPLAPKYSAPMIPPTNVLAKQIIASSDKLLFILHSTGSGKVQEWRLVRVAFNATVSLYTSCLMDGHYLVDFYLPHPLHFVIMWSTSGSGPNIIVTRTLLAQHLQGIPITFGHQRHLMPTLTDTTSSLTASFWTSLTWTLIFLDHSTLLPFTVARVATGFLRALGTSWSPTLICFTTQFHV